MSDDLKHLAQRVLDLDAQATEGPWETDGVYDLYVFRKPRGNGEMIADRNVEHDDEAPAGSVVRARGTGAGLTEAQQGANMRTIAEYRTAAPALARALLAALDENARLRGVILTAANAMPTEINPSNYDHDDVCRLNDESGEAVLMLRAALAETPK